MCRLKLLGSSSSSLQKRLGDADVKLKEGKKELELFAELNRGLIDNQKVFRDKLAAAEAERQAKDAQISVRGRAGASALVSSPGLTHACGCEQELQEQLRDLMMYIEAAGQIAQHSELAGGSAEVAPAPPPKRGARKARK